MSVAYFDSLLRGYPIGSFLFWKVKTDQAAQFVFYDFSRDYHERDHPHCERLNMLSPRPLVAILDGQQRLTALNIGLTGSHAEKLRYKWSTSPDAYPKQELLLDVLHEPGSEDEDMVYAFAFMTIAQAAQQSNSVTHWYRVKDIMSVEDDGPALFTYLLEHELSTSKVAFRTLHRLRRAVNDDPVINYFSRD